MQDLPLLDSRQSRSISPENFTGEKGKGGMADSGTGEAYARDLGRGWKVSPSVDIAAGATFEMAGIAGPGQIEQVWLTPTGTWRFAILRIYWDDQPHPSAGNRLAVRYEAARPWRGGRPGSLRRALQFQRAGPTAPAGSPGRSSRRRRERRSYAPGRRRPGRALPPPAGP